jgi:hypothetical protein
MAAAVPHGHLSMASRRTSNNFEPLFLRLEIVNLVSMATEEQLLQSRKFTVRRVQALVRVRKEISTDNETQPV